MTELSRGDVFQAANGQDEYLVVCTVDDRTVTHYRVSYPTGLTFSVGYHVGKQLASFQEEIGDRADPEDVERVADSLREIVELVEVDTDD